MATLEQMRRRVCDESGHWELVEDFFDADYDDNGCNALLLEAQRWLDRLIPRPRDEKYVDLTFSVGEYEDTIEDFRYLTGVYVVEADNTTTKLARKSYSWILENYGDGFSTIEPGTPEFWSVNPPNSGASSEEFSGVDIAIFPPTDAAITLRVYGAHYGTGFDTEDDDSETWWSVNEPGILCDAVRMLIEKKLHRNAQGARDFEADIKARLQEIYYDECAQEVQGPPNDFRMGAGGAE